MRGPLSILTLGLMATASLAAEPTGTITVTGSATIFVKPDLARIHYSVRVNEPAVDAAKHAASKQVTALEDAIAGLKLGGLSSSLGVPTYSRAVTSAAALRRAMGGFGNPAGPGGGGNPLQPPNPGPANRELYTAQVPLTATIREKDPVKLRAAVDLVLKTILESGAAAGGGDLLDFDSVLTARAAANEAPRVELFLDDDTAARRSALRTAVEKAKANATTLSRELGWESYKVLTLVDGPTGPRDPSEMSAPALRPPAGEVAVTARVTLICSR